MTLRIASPGVPHEISHVSLRKKDICETIVCYYNFNSYQRMSSMGYRPKKP